MTIYQMKLCTLALLLSGSTFSIGQNTSRGFLITKEGDTISGLIRTVMWQNDPRRINHFVVTRADNSQTTWPADQIAEYIVGSAIDAQDRKHYYGKIWPHNGLRTFLEPRVAGKTHLYAVPDPEESMLGKGANRVVFDAEYEDPRDNAYYISSPGTELVLRLEPENYELVLKQVLRDCPELTEQIGKKKYRFRNLEQIVRYYNESCAGENK